MRSGSKSCRLLHDCTAGARRRGLWLCQASMHPKTSSSTRGWKTMAAPAHRSSTMSTKTGMKMMTRMIIPTLISQHVNSRFFFLKSFALRSCVRGVPASRTSHACNKCGSAAQWRRASRQGWRASSPLRSPCSCSRRSGRRCARSGRESLLERRAGRQYNKT